MSMAPEAINALNRYNAVKPTVQATLDAMASDTTLASLVGASTRLAQAIAALNTSVKYRKQYASYQGTDGNHAARLAKEEDALAILNRAASDKNARSVQQAQETAVAQNVQLQRLAVFQAADAFPTLGESRTMQPGNAVPVPVAKPAFQWGKPAGGSPQQ